MCIKGGYILQPRAIDESDISSYPPHVREIWLYLLRKAYFKEVKIQGRVFNRGQLLTSYSDIINDLSWFIGWRKMSYKPHQCETATKLLAKADMITTQKTARGMIVTITKYDYYQAKENYENLTGGDAATAGEPQENRTKYKERKNVIHKDTIHVVSPEAKPGEEPKDFSLTPSENVKPQHEVIRELFNTICPSLRKVRLMSKSRKEKLTIRLKEIETAGESIENVFKKMEASDYVKGINKHKWKGTFDWVMDNDKNWLKVIEGNYDNTENSEDFSNTPNSIWSQKK